MSFGRSIRLDCNSHSYFHQLCGKKWATVEAVDVEVISLMVERLDKGHHNLGCMGEGTVNQLGLLSVINTYSAEVSRLAVGKTKALIYPPRVGLSLEILPKRHLPLEADDMATSWSGVKAASIEGEISSRKGWIFPRLVVLLCLQHALLRKSERTDHERKPSGRKVCLLYHQ